MTIRSVPFDRLALAAAIGVVVLLLARYDLCFQDAEMPGQYMANALANGPRFSLADIPAAFDMFRFDGDSRPRVVSYFAYILIVKTRLALWHIVPPHPSFSPLWPFALALAPWLLFKFLSIELRHRGAATAGVAVYLVSPGCLSGVTMLFHPAKPLANLLLIATLYLSSRIQQVLTTPDGARARPALLRLPVIGLLALLMLAPFVDESAVFAAAVPLVFCPAFFRPHTGSVRFGLAYARPWLLYLAPLGISALLILWAMPRIALTVSGQSFAMADYFGRMARSGAGLAKLDAHHVLWQAGNLLIPGLLPWRVAGVGTPVAALATLPWVALAGLAALILVVTIHVRSAGMYWRLYLKLALLASGYIVFQTLVFVFHPAELTATGFYYGAIFSIFFAALVAVVYADVAARGSRSAVWLARCGLIWVLAMSATNTIVLDKTWIAHSNEKALNLLPALPADKTSGDWTGLEWFRTTRQRIPLPKPGRCFADAMAIWSDWRRGDGLGRRLLTLHDVWLVTELSLDRRERSKR